MRQSVVKYLLMVSPIVWFLTVASMLFLSIAFRIHELLGYACVFFGLYVGFGAYAVILVINIALHFDGAKACDKRVLRIKIAVDVIMFAVYLFENSGFRIMLSN